MDASTEQLKSWSGRQVLGLTIVCLALGLASGYLLRAPKKIAAGGHRAASLAAIPVKADMPGFDQMKHMTDKKAEALLAQLEKNPNDVALLVELGKNYFYARQFESSAQYYERAAKVKPDPEVLTTLGNTYHYAGADDKAIDAFNRALAVDPDFANALFNLGMLTWKAHSDPEGAIAIWEKLLRKNPDHPKREQVREMIAQAKRHINMPADAKMK